VSDLRLVIKIVSDLLFQVVAPQNKKAFLIAHKTALTSAINKGKWPDIIPHTTASSIESYPCAKRLRKPTIDLA
jgi:hypothetical protein